MNRELITRATKCRDEIERLGKIIGNCSNAIEEVGHGADVKIICNIRPDINLSGCKLDDGQETLMQQLLIGILRNRMEEAEAELELLLPKDERMEARKHV